MVGEFLHKAYVIECVRLGQHNTLNINHHGRPRQRPILPQVCLIVNLIYYLLIFIRY